MHLDLTGRIPTAARVREFLADRSAVGANILAYQMLGTSDQLTDAIRDYRPQRLIVGLNEMRRRLPVPPR